MDSTLLDADAEMVIDTSEKIQIINSFDELGLNEQLLRGTQLESHLKTTPLFSFTNFAIFVDY